MRTPIAILGGGPAGCAAALTLRRYLPDLSVTLVTGPAAAAAGAPAVGETLSPGVLPLLRYLGIHQEFLNLEQLPAGGTASAWGSGQLFERTFLFHRPGARLAP
jgi:2-polyprenyl-6-methoxyphenol hydroxylase-like FAD-dependent oxidoreductase